MKKFIVTFSITVFFLVVAGGLAIAGVVAGSLYGYIDELEKIDIKNMKLNFTSFVYATDPVTGQTIELETLHGEQNRVWADIGKIPRHLIDAAVAIEDERFYEHTGFDIKRIIGAIYSYVTTGKASYGGSTITQQLIKGLTGEDDVSLKRKVQEIYRAYLLEQELSKSQILELYLNSIYLSQQCNGVQAAAAFYFNKDVSELTLAESASIIGITQYPNLYDPIINPDKNKEKQEIVLDKMLQLGKINRFEHREAVSEVLNFKGKNKGEGGDAVSEHVQSYYVDAIIDQVLDDMEQELGYPRGIASKLIYSGGLKIYGNVDINIQAVLDDVFKNDSNFPNISGDEKPQSAMLIMDPYNGHVLGVVGGRGEKTGQRTLNRAVHSTRQPGSTIKPLSAYAPALDLGYITAGGEVSNEPITINGWTPRNSGGGSGGRTTVRTAVEKSLNIPVVRIIDEMSLDTSFNFLKNNFKISTLVDNEKRGNSTHTDKVHSALALGGLTDGMSVMELTAAYATFVNKGMYNAPSFYSRVLDRNGKVILERQKNPQIAMSEQTAYIMTNLLQGVVTSGTGSAAKLAGGMPAAGKTGTTSDDKDRWFVGYTPLYVGSVWFGYDQPKSLGSLKTNPSVTIWKTVMDRIHQGKNAVQFPTANGVSYTGICTDSGMIATEYCELDPRGSRKRNELFNKALSSNGACTLHREYSICIDSGQQANTGCKNVVKRVGIVLTDPSEDELAVAIPPSLCSLTHSTITATMNPSISATAVAPSKEPGATHKPPVVATSRPTTTPTIKPTPTSTVREVPVSEDGL